MSADLPIGEGELKALTVDLDMLSNFLEGDPSCEGGWLSLRTGDVWPLQYGAELSEEDDDDWIQIDHLGSGEAYRDMVEFSASISDNQLSRLLEVALAGRGAFRRFKDVLADYPEERERWFAFSDQGRLRRAAEWLAELGYRALTPDGG